MLLSTKRYLAYHKQIEQLFEELTVKIRTIPISKIRNLMGLPNNWKRLENL